MKSPFFCGLKANASTQEFPKNPLFYSLRKHFLRHFCLLLLLSGSSFLSAQQLIVTPPKGDATHGDSSHLVTNLPKLPESVGISKKTPDYRYLYIYGDGNFTNYSKKDSIYHVFPPFLAAANNTYDARVYATAIYTGGNPPPRLRTGGIQGIDNDSKDPAIDHEAIISVLDTVGRDIKVQLNQDARAGDTMVAILSFRNPTPDTISGQVLLFHNGIISKESKTDELGGTILNTSATYSKFENILPIVHFNKINNAGRLYYNLPSGMGDLYERVLVQDYTGLAPGEEMHLFVEMTCDPAMNTYFSGKEKVSLNFTGMMTAFVELDTFLTDEQQAFVTGQKVNQVFDLLPQGDAETVGDVPTGGGGIFNDIARTIIDLETIETSLVKEHDPNELTVEACACPETDQHKLIFTVDCENDGYGNSNNLYIYLDIPAEIDINSFSNTPLKFFPPVPDGTILFDVDVAARQIKWTVPGLILDGTAELGYSAPSTQAQIVFSGLSSPGVALEDIPPMDACIRFIDDPVHELCTPLDTVSAIQIGSTSSQLLKCQTCEAASAGSGTGLPWWTWLALLLLLLLLLIIWAIRRNNS